MNIRQPIDMLEDSLIVKHLAGSRAYGTSLPTSDTDIRGIFCADELYHRSPWFAVNEISIPEDEDTKFYELTKFMQLLVDQNPNILESLWVDESTIIETSPAYDYLRSRRSELLSSKTAFTFSGYAVSQLKRIKGHNKWINNPQDIDPPRQIDFLTLVQNFTKAKILKMDGNMMEMFRHSNRLIPYGDNVFGLYLATKYDTFDAKFTLNTNSDDVDRNALGYPSIILKFNKEEYRRVKEVWKNYWSWKKNRNIIRAQLEHDHGYDCYSDDTEFLTRDGWKWYDDILTEELATFHPQTHKVEYHPIIERFDGLYNGNMFNVTGHHTDVNVTANHQMFIKEFSRTTDQHIGDWKLIEAAILPESFDTLNVIVPKANRQKMPSSFDNQILEHISLKDYIRLIGWYVSDGTCAFKDDSVSSVTIFQSKPQSSLTQTMNKQRAAGKIKCTETLHEPTGLANHTEHRWRFNREISQFIHTDCGHGSKHKRLPSWVYSLSKNEMRLMVTCLIQGDGTKKSHQDHTYVYYTSNELLADDVQRLALLCGYETAKWGPYNNDSTFGVCDMFQVHIHTNPKATRRRQRSRSVTVTPVSNQRIVCFTVTNHTLITRRNGKIGLHGNCKHAMHLVRLLRMGKEILTEGVVKVLRPDAKELLEIRDGKWSYNELVEYAEEMDNEIRDKHYRRAVIPKGVCPKVATEILLETQQLVWDSQ